jgi:hypothetical protein
MVLGDGLAMPPGTDASTLTRYLNQVHDDFVQTGQIDHALRRGRRRFLAARCRQRPRSCC